MITDAIYARPDAPVAQRVQDLLSRMTLREKIAQLTGFWVPVPAKFVASGEMFSGEFFRSRIPDGVGSIGPSYIALEHDVRYRNALQKFLREETRLGIPALVHDEGAHGLMKPSSTSFPSPLGLASAWNPELVHKIYDVVAREMRARGAHHALTPVIDVARDPRWGRIDETFGEDPFLNGRLGEQAVLGLQGSRDGSVDREHVLATLKHFTGHGTPEGGLNCSPALGGARELREVHMAPFWHVVKAANPAAVMPSYNEIDGVPAHASEWLLKTVLRDEWGYRGMIVSDYYGVTRLHAGHGVASSKSEAAELALKAGVQLELPVPDAFPFLEECVGKGAISMEQLDAAVAPLLAWKFKLGLFENPFVDARAAEAVVRAPTHRTLALQAAEESIVLLKNDGGLLPFTRGNPRRIAVIGPNAATTRLGGYSGDPLQCVSILEGIRSRAAGEAEVTYALGCELVKNDPVSAFDRWKFEDVTLATDEENRAHIEEAVKTAAAADTVVLVVGETESLCREAYSDKVVGDATTLEFPGSQPALIDAVLATGKPVVLYLVNGRPLALSRYEARAVAIVEAWYMGQESGTAAAKILFGDVSPSGKLAVSFPKSAGHIPAHYAKKPFAAQFPYIFSDNRPSYAFGHGLSYTTFAYAEPKLSNAVMRSDETVLASIEVSNTGKRDAVEVVQMYVHGAIRGLTRPVRELKGFQRIRLRPGESRRVEFAIDAEVLAIWDLEMKRGVVPGTYEIFMGGSSTATQQVALTIVS